MTWKTHPKAVNKPKFKDLFYWPDAIIRDVADALKQFRPVAEKNGVSAGWIGRVESTILCHLRAWGESEEPTGTASSEVNGHKISDIRIEQTYKGNYHL